MSADAATVGAPPQGRGLVAIGDSITRASGEAMLGLRMQSWALWLAEALEMPYSCLARDGARARDALLEQIPRLRGPYDLACVYVGVNDVRAPDWSLPAYRADLDALLSAVAARSRRLLLVRLPEQIGRPPAPRAQIALANRAIEELGARHGAHVLELSSLRGWQLVLPDAVHLSARGEAHLALLAARRLRAEGFACDERAILEALTPLRASARLRYACGAHGLARARDWRRRLCERAASRSPASTR